MDIERLIKSLESTDETERIYAAQDIAETHNPELAIPLVKRLQKEESQAVREAIAFALKDLPCSSAFDMLFELFMSPDAYLRNIVIDIFGTQGKESVSFLSSKLNNKNGEVRKLILDALFATDAPESLESIRNSLYDPSVNVRITAIEYLGRLGDTESIPKMIDMFRKDSEQMLRIAIMESISMIGEEKDLKEIFSVLAPNDDFTHIDPLFITQILRLLTRLGNPELFEKTILSIQYPDAYGEDILHAIEGIKERYKDICKIERVILVLKNIIENTDDKDLRDYMDSLIVNSPSIS